MDESPVFHQQIIEMALKYAAPHVIDGIRFNHSAQHIVALVYWQGVINGFDAALENNANG